MKKKLISFLTVVLLIPALLFAGPWGGGGGGSSMTYPGIGIPYTADGTSWGTSFGVGTLTDTYLCTYTTLGKTLVCNTNPASFAVANPLATDTLWDAAGDLVQGTGANTAAKLTKGAEGTLLRAGAASNAYSTSTFADTYAEGTLLYAGTTNTVTGLAHGTAYQLLQTNAAGTLPEWTSTISVSAVDMTSGTFTLPAGAVALNTTLGRAYFTTAANELSIGNGAASRYVPTFAAAGVGLVGTAAQTYTFPGASQTLSSLAGTETLTNKTLTTPVISALEVLIDCSGAAAPYSYCTSANASTLTATQVSRTIINSYGRAEAQTVTLPTAAQGETFIVVVGTQHNSAFQIAKGASTLYWEVAGVPTSKTYFQETNQVVGSRASCASFQTGAATWSWLCGSVSGTWVTD